MLPIKYIRSLTNDRTAQAVTSALSIHNELAAMQYLEKLEHRRMIEREAKIINRVQDRQGDKWIDREWDTHYRNKQRRLKKTASNINVLKAA